MVQLVSIAQSRNYYKQIGKKMGLTAIDKARKLKAKKIMLESNKSLTPALNLFRSLGFVNICADHHTSIYRRVNVTLELKLDK